MSMMMMIIIIMVISVTHLDFTKLLPECQQGARFEGLDLRHVEELVLILQQNDFDTRVTVDGECKRYLAALVLGQQQCKAA